MCTANSRRICVLCIFLYCFTCVKSARNSYVPRRPVILKAETTEPPKDVETVTDAYYMEKDYFINSLMKKYGDGETITYEGLEDLLYHLGVGGIDKLDLDKHVGHDHSHDHGSHDHSHDDHSGHDHSHDDHSGHDHSHDDHSGHDHSHDDHSGHDHSLDDHSGHDHSLDDHSGHDHSDDDHSGHDHSLDDHSGHDHSLDDHSGHDHSLDDHSGHDHSQDGHDLEVHTHSPHEDITEELSVEETNTTETKTNTTSEYDPVNDGDVVRRRRSVDQSQCLPAETLVKTVKINVKDSLTKAEFKDLCPSLIHQIDTNACYSRASGGHNHFHGDDEHDHHDHDHHELEAEQSKIDLSNVSAKVWGYSTIAVIIISLVGLLGVAVIPIMQKVFYNHLLQFLVALAVGALSGDALLHLIPHAMGGHVHGAPQEVGHDHGSHDNGSHDHGSHDHGSHDHDPTMIYKGLCALMGIYFFFWSERLLTIYTDAKRRKKEMKKKAKKNQQSEEVVGSKLADQCDGMMMSIHPNKALQSYVIEAHDEHCTKEFDDEFVSHQHGPCPSNGFPGNGIETALDGEERISMIGDTPKVRHGHGHSHGFDGVPTSVAAVAWMVIIGDGIHNFCDGLAIGAAFVNSITGGFSTSIAVLCHELPHEIGDFAMLLRAGMSAKQAIIYNCVSSILCFFGMLVGVAIGNVGGASLWVFSTVGGMFLYIGMVDMLPELSAVDTKKGEHPLCHLLLQIIGMLLGAGVMLAIALYEEDLMTVLEY